MKKYKVLDTKKMTEVKGGNCSWRGAGQAAVSGGIGGSLGGAVTVPVVGYVPGWVHKSWSRSSSLWCDLLVVRVNAFY